jgi:hypothetical protein
MGLSRRHRPFDVVAENYLNSAKAGTSCYCEREKLRIEVVTKAQRSLEYSKDVRMMKRTILTLLFLALFAPVVLAVSATKAQAQTGGTAWQAGKGKPVPTPTPKPRKPGPRDEGDGDS